MFFYFASLFTRILDYVYAMVYLSSTTTAKFMNQDLPVVSFHQFDTNSVSSRSDGHDICDDVSNATSGYRSLASNEEDYSEWEYGYWKSLNPKYPIDSNYEAYIRPKKPLPSVASSGYDSLASDEENYSEWELGYWAGRNEKYPPYPNADICIRPKKTESKPSSHSDEESKSHESGDSSDDDSIDTSNSGSANGSVDASDDESDASSDNNFNEEESVHEYKEETKFSQHYYVSRW